MTADPLSIYEEWLLTDFYQRHPKHYSLRRFNFSSLPLFPLLGIQILTVHED